MFEWATHVACAEQRVGVALGEDGWISDPATGRSIDYVALVGDQVLDVAGKHSV